MRAKNSKFGPLCTCYPYWVESITMSLLWYN